MSKFVFFFSFITLFNSPVFSQLDSISLTSSFIYENVEGYEGDSINQKIIKTETWVNDFDFFGEILIMIYDLENDYPVDQIKYTKQEIIDGGLILNNVITIKSYTAEEERSYKIVSNVRNFQGNNLPLVETVLNH